MPEEANTPPSDDTIREESSKPVEVAEADQLSENETPLDSKPPQPSAAETAPAVVPQPTSETSPETATSVPGQSSTVELVWQWLTYGLWSWTLASLGILLTSTLAYFISSDTRNSDSSWLVYIIATTLCLLPISFVIDHVYSKHEPEHKRGFAAIILVIHAVLAFLVSVGSLITAVVTLLSLATDTSGDTAVKTTVIISALLIALLGALFFVRIVRPPKLEIISRKFRLIVTAFAAVVIIAALVGPYVATIQAKSDRQLEAGLPGLNSAVQDYARDNKKLPGSLNDLTFSSYQDEAESLVKNNLVSYTAKGSTASYSTYSGRTLKYELCATYKKSKGSGSTTRYSSSSDYGSSYISTYSHPEGHTCYQQSVYISRSSTITPTILD
ncbi:hypothetical protein BH09PAT4_BH09PAT4_04400 [soil metagenome]